MGERGRRMLGALLLLAATACGGGDPTPPDEPGATQEPAAQEDGAVVSGTVVTADGTPLQDAELKIIGTPASTGEYIAYSPRSDANGQFRARVLPGEYTVTGTYMTEYLGQRYTFDLHPTEGTRGQTFVAGAEGVQRDFVWKISGRRPGSEGASDQGHAFYGGQANFVIADVLGESFQNPHFEAEFPQGFEAQVTLEPEGPLIDGSAGTPISITHTVASKFDPEWSQVDIPVGQYRIEARVVEPDGSTKPLEVLGAAPLESGLAGRQDPPVLLTFEAGAAGLRTMKVVLAYGPPYDPVDL